jgi:hypothetical protein
MDVVGTTVISKVNPETDSPTYRGYAVQELTMAERVEITGPADERYVEILSPRALGLLVAKS